MPAEARTQTRYFIHPEKMKTCNACKRRILIRERLDMFGRPLHARCQRRANMAPELALLLRACVEKLGHGAAFSIEEIMAAPPVGFTRMDDTIVINSHFAE